MPISIHALREEGDLAAQHDAQALVDFYPRPPRGGRRKLVNAKVCKRQFLSTPSARRATVAQPMLCAAIKISIHALREEGDALGRHCPQANPISIHALREEGDDVLSHCPLADLAISIHALREEGDSKNRDKISIFKQIIQHSARI